MMKLVVVGVVVFWYIRVGRNFAIVVVSIIVCTHLYCRAWIIID